MLIPFLVGLERTFRFLQALFQIIASYPAVFGLFLSALDFGTASHHAPAETLSVILGLRQRMNLARRFFRLFRFIESFHAAQKLYVSIMSSGSRAGEKKQEGAPPAQPEAWLDVFARTFNGMYLLLDAPGIVGELKIEGLQLWSAEWDRAVMLEAQRFWLFALACGALSSFLKMQRLRSATPVKVVGREAAVVKGKGSSTVTAAEKEEAAKADERIRAKKIHGLTRNVAANSLDIVLPGAVIGWIDAGPGTVGLAMLATTVLTGMDAWERCGREVSG